MRKEQYFQLSYKVNVGYKKNVRYKKSYFVHKKISDIINSH